MVLQPLVDLSRFFSFLILYTFGRTRVNSMKGPTYTQNKGTRTPMSRVGFEPMIQVFERVKTVHASDRAGTVIGPCHL
jgi:hypothetical protein